MRETRRLDGCQIRDANGGLADKSGGAAQPASANRAVSCYSNEEVLPGKAINKEHAAAMQRAPLHRVKEGRSLSFVNEGDTENELTPVW